jgi:antitoxin VapB
LSHHNMATGIRQAEQRINKTYSNPDPNNPFYEIIILDFIRICFWGLFCFIIRNICLTYAAGGLYLAYDRHIFRGDRMKTVSIFKNGKNQAVRLPKEMEFQGVNELAIDKDGDIITLRPVRPDWLSFTEIEKADSDFMLEREDVLTDEGRFTFE